MKKQYIFLVFFIGIPTVSSAEQTVTDSIRFFVKTHEGKIAVIATAVAGIGMGSIITYCLCNKKNKEEQGKMSSALESKSKEIEDLKQQLTSTNVQSEGYKKRLAEIFKNEFENYFKYVIRKIVNKELGVYEVSIEIFKEGFRVHLKGDQEIFGTDAASFETNYGDIIKQWPQWMYQNNKWLAATFWFSDYQNRGASYGLAIK